MLQYPTSPVFSERRKREEKEFNDYQTTHKIFRQLELFPSEAGESEKREGKELRRRSFEVIPAVIRVSVPVVIDPYFYKSFQSTSCGNPIKREALKKN